MSSKISTAHKKKTKRKTPKVVPIVAIGASAGGLEAITSLLKKLPADTGMAYIYIQHLDPDHKSMLSVLLSKATKMKVSEARHLKPLAANNLYIIPPDKDMAFLD